VYTSLFVCMYSRYVACAAFDETRMRARLRDSARRRLDRSSTPVSAMLPTTKLPTTSETASCSDRESTAAAVTLPS
jgi:hypothetical protein